MTRRLACIIAILLLCAPPVWAQVWNREPAGFTTLLECPFTGAPASCGITDAYGSSSQTTDVTEPVSPPGAVLSRIFAGQNSGGMQLDWFTPGGTTYREMFVGLMWRTNPGFEGRPQGNKTFFMRGPWIGGPVNTFNGVFLFNNASLSGGTGQMIFAHNTGSLNNGHACGGDAFGAICYPNAGAGILSVGVWTNLQAYIKCSSSPTARDGIVRWWINGAPAGNYTNLNYCSNGLNNWSWSETWDGTRNFVVSREWNHLIGHLHVSFLTGAGGGGSTPPPPPPLPPNKPTNLRVQ
jgi:hypothetical protein